MWAPDQTVLDRYLLRERLAQGGGGETWLARGPHGDVAVKLIRGEDRRRFRDLIREASLLRDLRHPRIVHYREFADRPDEQCAILVTDWVPGGDLEAWVAMTGAMSPQQVVDCGLQLVEALTVLAESGVLHRDLKPTNVLVEPTESGLQLRVADFGISRPLQDGIAQTNDRSLTPQYAAPEQHRGDAELTTAADLYALGGVLGYLATGAHPGDGGGPHSGHAPLDDLIKALMALNPGDRPSLIRTSAALNALADGQPLGDLGPSITVVPPLPEAAAPQPSSKGMSSSRGIWAAVGGGLLLTITGLGVLVTQWPAPPPIAETPDTTLVTTPPEPPPAPEAAKEVLEVTIAKPAPAQPVPEPTATTNLLVNSRPWSWVSIDGERVGRTTVVGLQVMVPVGRHTITLESEGGLVWSQALQIGDEHRLCVNLRTGTEIEC